MQRQWMISAGLSAVCLLASCASTRDTRVPPTEAEVMQRWTDFMTPSAGHQVLEERVGTWKLEVKYWMPGAAEPEISLGTSTVKWIMDGRYLEDHTEANNPMGRFEGRGFVGYDNLKKKYFGTWIDTSGTGLTTSSGHFDAAKGQFNFTGEMPDAMAGKYTKFRQVEQRISADQWRVEMFVPTPDGEFKNLELNYTRM